MSGMTVHLRGMLLPYEQQLLTARRSACSRKSARSAVGGDEPRIDPRVQRRAIVERAARDMLDAAARTDAGTAATDTGREPSARAGNSVVRFFPSGENERKAEYDLSEAVVDRRV